MKQSIPFIFLICLLAFISFYPAFSFSFIIDDWYQLWGVFYDKSLIEHYITTQHPNSAYEFLIFAPIFKFNPFYYQLLGYFLKVIGSLSVSLLVFSITKIKKVAFFSGIFFATSVIGLETFSRISAQNSALMIPSLCLGLFFWIEAIRFGSLYRYSIALILFIFTILQDPGVGIIVIPTAIFWSLLTLIRNFNKYKLKRSLLNILSLILIPLSLKWYINPRLAQKNSDLTRHLFYVLGHPVETITHFLTSIGNLTIGWIFPFQEFVSLTTSNFWTILFGYLTLLTTLTVGIFFLKKRTEPLMVMFFLLVWVFLFYFLNWFTQSHYVEGAVISAVSNRYLAISSIGLIGFIAYLINFLKPRIQLIFFSLIIFINVLNSLRILNDESIYRSVKSQDLLFNRIDQDLPKGNEENRILMVLGDYKAKVAGFEWNGFYPLALRRNITNQHEFSTIVNNLEEAKVLLCNHNDSSKFRISDLYSWQMQNNNIYNVSKEVRKILNQDCEDSKNSST